LVLADLDRQGLLYAVREVDVLWVRLRHHIDAEVMATAQRLKFIVTATTGLDHIDLDEAVRHGIQVLSLRGHSDFLQEVHATAEHTVALMLALLRHIPSALAHVRTGGWDRDLFRGSELFGKIAGVVGYGRLGRIVARYLNAFGMHVLAADPNVDAAAVMTHGVTLAPLTRLLPEADVVTLHVNLCHETRGFFNRELFSLMKQGAWLINTSRGELLDEVALLDALHSRHLAGAALDVLCDEGSNSDNVRPLVRYARDNDNLIITPHIAGCTGESMKKTEDFMAHKLADLFKDRLPPDSEKEIC
jgi:D-3-phosphoglycerate dehydrogenase